MQPVNWVGWKDDFFYPIRVNHHLLWQQTQLCSLRCHWAWWEGARSCFWVPAPVRMTWPSAGPLSQVPHTPQEKGLGTIPQFHSGSPRMAQMCMQGKTSEPGSRDETPQTACLWSGKGNPTQLSHPSCSFTEALYKLELCKGQHLEEWNSVGALWFCEKQHTWL